MQYLKFVLLALVALVAFKVAFTLMGDGGSDEQKGDLIVEPRIVNLGNVVVNQKINFSTSMRNNGQKTIKIASVGRTCGCITASPAKETCLPGEAVSVSGTLTPGRQERFRYLVRLIEADASAPEHVFEVVGNAVAGSGSSVSQSGSSNP